MTPGEKLVACDRCGLIQRIPAPSALLRPHCVRCDNSLTPYWWHDRRAAATLALSALILYVPSILLPLMRIEMMGHSTEASIIQGVSTLLADRHYFVGLVVLLFSLVLPPLKLLAILLLSGGWVSHARRARLHHGVELLGRWGMLDVLVVAVLVAFVKLGDTVSIEPGVGLALFLSCVLLSLLSSVCLHLPSLWEEEVR
jgi:paraquat-inducible protein A